MEFPTSKSPELIPFVLSQILDNCVTGITLSDPDRDDNPIVYANQILPPTRQPQPPPSSPAGAAGVVEVPPAPETQSAIGGPDGNNTWLTTESHEPTSGSNRPRPGGSSIAQP